MLATLALRYLRSLTIRMQMADYDLMTSCQSAALPLLMRSMTVARQFWKRLLCCSTLSCRMTSLALLVKTAGAVIASSKKGPIGPRSIGADFQ